MALTKYDQDGFHYWAPTKKLGGGWIAFKSAPEAPKVPDPYVTAAAQTKSNIDTANANAENNRINQTTPWGNVSYTKGAQNPDGTYQWSQDTKLAPEQQALLDSSNKISQSMADLGQNQINNVAGTINKPLDFNSLSKVQQGQLQTSAGQSPQFQRGVGSYGIQSSIPGAGQIQNGYSDGGRIQGNLGSAGDIQRNIDTSGVGQYSGNAAVGGIQNGLDASGVPSLVGGDQLSGAMRDAQNAAYAQHTSRLDPQWQQQQHDLQNQLTQQGVMQNSDAWNRAMDDFGRNKNDAYQTAYNNAVNNGNAAEAQLYGQGLSSNQNAFGQTLSKGNFANSAQQQQASQALANAQLQNDATSRQFAQAQAQQQAANAAQSQLFGQNLGGAQFANSAQAQQNAQNAALAAFGNNAQQQGFGENAANASFGNAAQGQQFGQGMQNAGLNNASLQQLFQNNAENAQLNNAAQSQLFGQSMGARNQSINELLQQQQNPLNVLNAIRTGSQVTAPTFGQVPGANVGNTDIMSAINNAFNGQMGAYNGQVATQNANTGALASIAAAFAGGKGSDRSIKQDIEQIGVRSDGIGIYSFEYKPPYRDVWGHGRQIGVMADEVEKVLPHAVAIHADGYKMVNYGML